MGTGKNDSTYEDYERWQREIIEALRPIDPAALFWVGLTEIDFRQSSGHRREDFPYHELVRFVDEWLAGVDPDGEWATTTWEGGGIGLGFRAKGRTQGRGWKTMPSLNLLEQPISDLHLVDGGRRQLHTLTLEEVRRLASGELRVIGQGASYRDTFASIAEALQYYGFEELGQLAPSEITVFAGMLGLVEAPPDLGNYDRGWRAI